MFWNIYKPELNRNFKSPALYVFTAVLFFTTFWFIKNTTYGHTLLYVTITKEWHNAPIIIARLMAGFSLIGVLITMVMIGRSVARDFTVKIHDFYFTSPLSKSVYLWGRFFGGYTANLMIFAGIDAGRAVRRTVPVFSLCVTHRFYSHSQFVFHGIGVFCHSNANTQHDDHLHCRCGFFYDLRSGIHRCF